MPICLNTYGKYDNCSYLLSGAGKKGISYVRTAKIQTSLRFSRRLYMYIAKCIVDFIYHMVESARRIKRCAGWSGSSLFASGKKLVFLKVVFVDFYIKVQIKAEVPLILGSR